MNAAFFQEVTMFQPIRPFVRWSRVENRLASRKGGSKEVDAVIPNASLLVTAAIALMGYYRVKSRFRCGIDVFMTLSVAGLPTIH